MSTMPGWLPRGAPASTATSTADQGAEGIRVRASRPEGVVEGLAGVDPDTLDEMGRVADAGCTISILLRPSVPITVAVRAAEAPGGSTG